MELAHKISRMFLGRLCLNIFRNMYCRVTGEDGNITQSLSGVGNLYKEKI